MRFEKNIATEIVYLGRQGLGEEINFSNLGVPLCRHLMLGI